LLRERRDSIFGILNGIDDNVWNPDTDESLTQTFDAESLRMRTVNKAALQREVGFHARQDVPLLGMISRLDRLKGLDILIPGLESLLQREDVQIVILGTGAQEYEEQLREFQVRFPERVRTFIKFDDRLARRIYGGIDLFMLPSLREPGALGQMIAMRYGALPVVRATGGLADTVIDADAQPQRGTGFVFEPYTVEAFEGTLLRALVAYRDPPRWQILQRRAMEMDFSWSASARAYLDLYRRVQSVHQRTA
ncbi:MAG: glycogen synthase, partial [Anaerolineae bacterium]